MLPATLGATIQDKMNRQIHAREEHDEAKQREPDYRSQGPTW